MTPWLIVLWFWSAVSWGFHGVVLSPGWAAVAVFETQGECETARDAIPLRQGLQGQALACLPAGVEPRGAIAEMLSR